MGLKDYRPEKVIEVGGERVLVRGLTVGQSERLAAEVSESDPMVVFQCRVVAACVYTEDGAAYFAGPDEVRPIHRGVMQKLFEAALEVSGLNEGAVEEAEKN